MDNSEHLQEEITIAQAALKQAEERFGPNHPAVAFQLENYARLLRKTPDGLLTAVNLEARAKAIKQHNEAGSHNAEAKEFRSGNTDSQDLIESWIPNKTFFQQAQKWCQDTEWLPRLVLLLFFAFIFVRHLQDPLYASIFKGLNLGIHELGHFVFAPFGQFIQVAGGSFFQCLVPFIAIFMFYRQRDFFAIAIAFGWLSTNLFDVASYIADARAEELPLVSPIHGDEVIHDWNYLLGQLNLLNYDTLIASWVRGGAIITMLICLAFGAWLIFTIFRSKKH